MSTMEHDDTNPHPPLEYEMFIDATPEQVWHAITHGDGIKSWFSYDARVDPGVGGTIFLSWGPSDENGAPITAWDPPHHFQWTEHRGPWQGDPNEPPVDIVIDFHLEAQSGGGTILRLVQDGMGPGEAWDGEYHATAEDWPMFLATLVHYASNHEGTIRDVMRFVHTFSVPVESVWTHLFGHAEAVRNLTIGQPYELRFAGRETLRGMVKLLQPGRRIVASVQALNDAIMVITAHDKGESTKVSIEVSTWGVDESTRSNATSKLKDALESISTDA